MADAQLTQVKPQDALGMTITLTGVIGADLASVAGRETIRGKMIEAATQQIDTWIEGITVLERKP